MWRVLLPALLVIVLFPGSVRAKEYWVIGAGHQSCATWTADRRTKQWISEAQWFFGFLSGVGYMGVKDGIDPLRGMHADGVLLWLDTYCHTHPTKQLGDAAAEFVRVYGRPKTD